VRSGTLSCLVLSCLVLSCLVLSCFVLSCLVLVLVLVLPCLVLSYLVLSCLVLSCDKILALSLLPLTQYLTSLEVWPDTSPPPPLPPSQLLPSWIDGTYPRLTSDFDAYKALATETTQWLVSRTRSLNNHD
jgi:hypothetical protein